MRSLLMITTSRRQKDVWRIYVPTVGWIHRSLFPAQFSQICCQSSVINLLTHGKNSEAGSLIGVTARERAADWVMTGYAKYIYLGILEVCV